MTATGYDSPNDLDLVLAGAEEGRVMRVALIPAAVVFCQLMGPTVARAGCWDPACSHIDPCMIACPAGDSVFLVILRDFGCGPRGPAETVTIDFSNCSGFHLSPVSGDEPYAVDSTGLRISMITDETGSAAFPIRGGGGCGEGMATVIANCYGSPFPGFFPPDRAVASPDQNGDLVVDDTDVGLVQAKVGSSDASADFDCDGVVTSADVDIARAHLGHRAPAALAVGPGAAAGLSLAAHPNPASGRFIVSFSVPSAAPTTIELLDLSGRLVQRREAGYLTSGRHTMSLALDPHPRAGLYFLVVDQPPRRLLAKVCVLP